MEIRDCLLPFKGKSGLEISGPSKCFTDVGEVPLYSMVGNLDDYSFPRPERWGGRTLNEGKTFRFGSEDRLGWQYIGDAGDMSAIASEKYDFILASHVFEHIANPLAALSEWLRILRPGGNLLLVVPHRDGTFDRKRPLTTIEHIISDFEMGTDDRDETHFSEVRELSESAFTEIWYKENFYHRGLHHHVFDTDLMVKIYDVMNIKISFVAARLPYHIIISGQKRCDAAEVDNAIFRGSEASYLKDSPFPSDLRRKKADQAV